MHYSNVYGSQSQPNLHSNHGTTNLRSSQTQMQVSIDNIHQNFANLNHNIEDIRQVDSCLQNGIHDARQKLIRAMKVESEGGIGVATIHHHQGSNTHFLNETIRKQNLNWVINQTPVNITRTSRFNARQGEQQRIGGISVGPARNNEITVRQNSNVRSRQRISKVGEDVFELKRIIQQKDQQILFLQQQLHQFNLKLAQQRNRPISINPSKCVDCEKYISIIRQLEEKLSIVNERFAGQDFNKILNEIKSANNENRILKTRITEIEREKKIEIEKLTAIIEKMKLKASGIINQTNLNEENQIVTLRRQIKELTLTIEKQELEIQQKNYRIKQIEHELLSSSKHRSGSKEQECQNCNRVRRQLESYKSSNSFELQTLRSELDRANEKIHRFSQRETQYQNTYKSAEQIQQQNQRFRFLNQRYTNEIQMKEQTISDLNETIMILKNKLKERASSSEIQGTQFNQKTIQERFRRVQRDMLEKIQELESQNKYLKSENVNLVNQLEAFTEENKNILKQLTKSQYAQENYTQAQIKGYYYSTKLQQLETLLSKFNYTELNIKINRLLNDKNVTLKQILSKRSANSQNLLEFGSICYALDEIIQRLIESLQHNYRALERIKAQRDSLNQYSIKAEQSLRKSGTLSQEAKEENRRLENTLTLKQLEISELKQRLKVVEKNNFKSSNQFQGNLIQKDNEILRLRDTLSSVEREANSRLQKLQSTLTLRQNQITNLRQQLRIFENEGNRRLQNKQNEINSLKEQIKSIERDSRSDVLTNEVIQLTEKLMTIQQESNKKLESRDNEIKHLKQILASYQIQFNVQLEHELRNKNNEIRQLNERLRILEIEISSNNANELQKKISQLQIQIQSKQLQFEEQRKRIKNQTINQFNKSSITNLPQIQQLQRQLQVISRQRNQHQRTISVLQQEKYQIEQQYHQTNRRLAQSQTRITALEANIDRLEKQRQQLRLEKQSQLSQQQSHQQLNELQLKNKQLNDGLRQLQQQRQLLERERIALRQSIQQERQIVISQLTQLKAEREKINLEVAQFNQNEQRMMQQYEDLNIRMEQFNRAELEYTQKLEGLKQEVFALQKNRNNLVAEREAINKQKLKVEQLRAQVEKERNGLREQSQRELRINIEKNRSELQAKIREFERALELERQKTAEVRREFELKIQTYQRQIQKLTGIIQQNKLVIHSNSSEEELKNIKSKPTGDISQQAQLLRQKNYEMTSELERLRRLEARNNSMGRQIQAKQAKFRILQQDIQRLKVELANKQNLIEAISQENSQLRLQIESTHTQTKQLLRQSSQKVIQQNKQSNAVRLLQQTIKQMTKQNNELLEKMRNQSLQSSRVDKSTVSEPDMRAIVEERNALQSNLVAAENYIEQLMREKQDEARNNQKIIGEINRKYEESESKLKTYVKKIEELELEHKKLSATTVSGLRTSQTESSLKNEIQRLNIENTQISRESQTVHEELERIRRIYEQLERQYKNQRGNFELQIRRIIQEQESKFRDLEHSKQNELKELQIKHNVIIKTFKTTIKDLETEIRNLNDKLQNENFKKNNEIKVLQGENSRLIQRIKSLQTTIHIHTNQQLKLGTLEEENAKILEQLKFLTQELQRLNNQLQKLSAELRQATSLYEREKNKLSGELESTRRKKDEIYENLLKAENYIGKCQEQIQELKKLLQQQGQKVKELMLKQANDSQNKSSGEHQKVVQQFKEALIKSQNEKDQLIAEIKNLKQQLQSLQHKLEQNNRQNVQRTNVETEIQRLQRAEEERIKLAGQNEIYRQQVNRLEAEIKDLTGSIERLDVAIQTERKQKSEALSQLKLAQNEIERLMSFVQTLQNEKVTSQQISKQFSDKSKEYEIIINQLRDSITKTQQITELKQKQYQLAIQHLKQQIDGESRQAEISNFQRLLENLTKAETHIQFIQSELARLENENNLLQEKERIANEQSKNRSEIQAQLQQERQRNRREIESFNNIIARNQQLVAISNKQLESKAIQISEKDKQLKLFDAQRQNLINNNNQTISKLQTIEVQLNHIQNIAHSLQIENTQLKLINENLNNNNQQIIKDYQELRVNYEAQRQQADHNRLRFNEADAHIKYLEFAIQDLKKNILRLTESENKVENLFEKIMEIEAKLRDIGPEQIKQKNEKLVGEFDNIIEQFNKKVQEEKERAYNAFIGEFPERAEEIKKAMTENVIKQSEKSLEKESSLIDDLSCKLISIERDKKSVMMDLERIKLLRETQLKLQQAQNKIRELESQLDYRSNKNIIKTEERISDVEGGQPQHISSIILSERDIARHEEQVAILKEKVYNYEEKLFFMEDSLKKKELENLNLLREKEIILKDANALSAEIQGIRRQFANVQLIARQNIQGEIDALKQKYQSDIGKLNQKLVEQQQQYERRGGDTISPVKKYQFEPDQFKGSEGESTPGKHTPILSPTTTQIQTLKQKVASLENRLIIEQQNEKEMVEKITSLTIQLQEIQQRSTALAQGHEILKNNYFQKTTKLQSLQGVEEALNYAESYIFDKQKQINTLKETICNLEKELSQTSTKIAQLNQIIDKIRLNIEELERQIGQKNNQITELQSKIYALQNENSSVNTLKQKNKELTFNKSKLQTQIHLMQQSFKEIQSQFHQKNSELEKNVKQLEQQQKLKNQFEREKENLVREVENKNKRILQSELQIATLRSEYKQENNQLKDKIKALEAEVHTVMSQNSNLSVAMNFLSQQAQDLRKGNLNVADLNQTLLQKQIALNEKENRIIQLQNVLTNIENQLQQIKAQSTSKDKQIHKMMIQTANLQDVGKKIQGELHEVIENLRLELGKTEEEKIKLLDYNANLEKKLKEYEVKALNLIQELEDKQRKDNEQREKQKIEMTQKSSQIAQISTQIHKLKDQIERSSKQNQQLIQSNNQIQDQLNRKLIKEAELIQENENIIKNLQIIEQHLVKTEQDFNDQKKNKADEISILENRLKQMENNERHLKQKISILEANSTNTNAQFTSLIAKLDVLNEEVKEKNKLQEQLDEEHKKFVDAIDQASLINQRIAHFSISNQQIGAEAQRPTLDWLAYLNDTIWQQINNLTAQVNERQSKIQLLTLENEKLAQQAKDVKKQFGQTATIKKQSQVIEQRYEQLMAELVEYETLNKKLTEEVQRLSQEIILYKSKVEEHSKQAMDSSNEHNSSLENQQLRKRLENAQSIISKREKDAEGQILEQEQGRDIRIEFLRQSLRKITFLQQNIDNIQSELNQNSTKLKKIIDNYSQDTEQLKTSQLRLQLNQLQHHLIQNEKEINESCENVDHTLKDIRELLNSEPQKEVDKEKLKILFDQLENNVRENQKLHEQQLVNMALSLRQGGDHSQRFRSDEGDSIRIPRHEEEELIGYKTQRLTISDRAQLIRQVKELSKLIDIYHKQAQRRKKIHIKVVTKLQAQILKLKEICGELLTERNEPLQAGSPVDRLIGQIGSISLALETELQKAQKKDDEQRESSGFGQITEQEILAGRGQGHDNHLIQSLRQSLNENSRQIDFSQIVNQPNFDARAFLDYIFQTHEFEREEILELKRKIAALKSRQTRINMDVLQEKRNEIQSLLENNKQKLSENIEVQRFIEAAANSIEPEQIQEIFSSQNNQYLINRILEAMRDEQSISNLRQMDSQFLIEQIKQIMQKYYPQSNKLSNALYQFILLMLASPNDEILLGITDNIFATILEVQSLYIKTIQEKDKIFKQHKEMLDRVLERTSSDDSDEIKNMMQEEGFQMQEDQKYQRSP